MPNHEPPVRKDILGNAERPRLQRALSDKAITIGAMVVVTIAVASVWILLAAFGGGTAADNSRLDAIRTASTIVLGAGGGIALYLAARRQRSNEIDILQKEDDLELRDRAQRHVEHEAAENQARQIQRDEIADQDAASRRLTELYTAAAEQVGHASAPVRLAGFYAMERLAQDNPEQRQTIVNVLCAYLRMPYEPPPPLEKPVSEPTDFYEARQEREVRLTAQRILANHLHRLGPAQGDHHWEELELDLSGAYLIDFQLETCSVRFARFTGAHFGGPASFWRCEFDCVQFEGAIFDDTVDFSELRTRGDANFAATEFASRVNFDNARVTGTAAFAKSIFDQSAIFAGAHLASSSFTAARFGGYASFDGVSFDHEPHFEETQFAEPPSFSDTTFGAHLARPAAHDETDSCTEH